MPRALLALFVTLTVAVDAPQVGEMFKCYSFTLEMPFKDNAEHPDHLVGWSPERCKHFGRSILQPIYEILPNLRPGGTSTADGPTQLAPAGAALVSDAGGV